MDIIIVNEAEEVRVREGEVEESYCFANKVVVEWVRELGSYETLT